MPRAAMSGGSTELPSYMMALLGHSSQEWEDEALCRRLRPDLPDDSTVERNTCWTIEPNERLHIGGSIYRGSTLIELALQICGRCPVQWDCAAFALRTGSWEYKSGRWTEMIFGTWGCHVDDLRWMARLGADTWEPWIQEARLQGEPVQVMVAGRRDDMIGSQPCRSSATPTAASSVKTRRSTSTTDKSPSPARVPEPV